MAMTSLYWPDYVILAAFLCASLGIGLYHSLTGGRQRTTQEFIMANRKLGILPTAMSLFVSFQSAIVILGTTAEMYQFGAQYLIWEPVAVSLAILLTERLMVPWIFPLKLMSINDYLERRYESRAVRILGTVAGLMDGVIYMGVAMYAPSAALESATGLPTSVSIPLMAVVSITYTAMGGMRAVIWTDVMQFLAFMGGVIAVFVKGLLVVGGYYNVLDICEREGRLELADWSLNPTVRHTVWGFMIGRSIDWARFYGLSQASVQRYSATETLTKARIVILLNIPTVFLLYFLTCSNGLAVFSYYSTVKCDPIVNGDVSTPNQLLSLFVMTIFSDSRGFAGLFLATLYGGALSSVSSYLSGSAANCWDDLLRPTFSGLREYKKAILNRLLVVIFGVIAMGIAYLASVVPGPIIQVYATYGNAVFGPIYGIFIMGGLSKYANWKGALIGGLGSLCINIWLNLGALTLSVPLPTLPPVSTEGCQGLSDNSTWLEGWANETTRVPAMYSYSKNVTHSVTQPELVGLQHFYAMSYIWYSLFGVLNTLIIGMIASLIFRDRDAEARVEDHLFIPFRQILSWSSPSKKHIISEDDEPAEPLKNGVGNHKLSAVPLSRDKESDLSTINVVVKPISDDNWRAVEQTKFVTRL